MIIRKKRKSVLTRGKAIKGRKPLRKRGLKRTIKTWPRRGRKRSRSVAGITDPVQHSASYNKAYDAGFDSAYNEGFDIGYHEGMEAGHQEASKGE